MQATFNANRVYRRFKSRVSSRKKYTACSRVCERQRCVDTAAVSVQPQWAGCCVFRRSVAGSSCACTDKSSTQTVSQVRPISTNENLFPCACLKRSNHRHIVNCEINENFATETDSVSHFGNEKNNFKVVFSSFSVN